MADPAYDQLFINQEEELYAVFILALLLSPADDIVLVIQFLGYISPINSTSEDEFYLLLDGDPYRS